MNYDNIKLAKIWIERLEINTIYMPFSGFACLQLEKILEEIKNKKVEINREIYDDENNGVAFYKLKIMLKKCEEDFEDDFLEISKQLSEVK
jgi:hypothetical protein